MQTNGRHDSWKTVRTHFQEKIWVTAPIHNLHNRLKRSYVSTTDRDIGIKQKASLERHGSPHSLKYIRISTNFFKIFFSLSFFFLQSHKRNVEVLLFDPNAIFKSVPLRTVFEHNLSKFCLPYVE